GKLGKRPYRRKHLFLLALLGHALVAHARAWLKQERKVDDSASGDGILAALFRRRGAPGAKVA
ncbi:MAG: hypothetical protein HYV63_25000, partial [Candidatus Schekmanbacteria bacterium]|nr:hypothetical protein [Candidatus Schekmanbacteria bacterium]